MTDSVQTSWTESRWAIWWVYAGSLAAVLDRATYLETAAELCSLGWDVTLVTADSTRPEVDERVKVLQLPRPRLYLLGYLVFHMRLLICLLLRERDVDMVLFEPETAPFFLFVEPFRLMGNWTTSLVMDIRSLPMSTLTAREKLRALLFRIGQWIGNRVADGQTAITCRLAHEASMPQLKLLGTWPSGVRVERFAAAASLRSWPAPGQDLHLIYIGSLRVERNLLPLCEAVVMAREEGMAVVLDLVGEGPQGGALDAYARLKGGGAIHVLPTVPYQEVPRVLASAHVGVLPFPDRPEFRVSSPIKLFEYMAAGMAVLATRITCHTDVCEDGGYVFWAEGASPAELVAAIRAACARQAELDEMGRKALEASRAWTWRESARQLASALSRVMSTENPAVRM